MGWLSPEHSQWMCIARKWCRLVNMDESLLAKKIFLSHLTQGSTNCKICTMKKNQHLNGGFSVSAYGVLVAAEMLISLQL